MAAGRLIIPLAEPVLTSSGIPSPNATLTVYLTGTTTLAVIYADEGLTTPILNPQTSNAAGRFYVQSTEIWADLADAYDVVLALTDGETFTYDAISLLGAASSTGGFAPLNSPNFTGEPTAPTPATNDNSDDIATTAYVQANIASLASLNSPALTGTPTAPTQATGDDSTAIATDAFVQAAIIAAFSNVLGALDGYLKLPGGLVFQWGAFSALIGSQGDVAFPTAFPANCFIIVGSPGGANGTNNCLILTPNSNTTFHWDWAATTGGASFNIFWFAIGN